MAAKTRRVGGWLTASILLGLAMIALVAARADEPNSSDKPATTKKPVAQEKSDTGADEQQTPKENPYIPRKGLSADDLRAYIQRLQEAPATIRNRRGFAEGIAVAAERILATDPKGSLRTFAVVNLLDALDQWADLDESHDADVRLAELATKYSDDSDKKIADVAKLYALEQRVLKADDIDPAKLPELLDNVKKALDGKQLDARSIRLASATVHAINRLKDDADANRRLKEFGQLFAASSDEILSRYGKKIAASGAPEEDSMKPKTDFTGKQIEIAGPTAEGGKFDIAQYKGKVVLVDFWATWCGPCRAALPDLKDTYEKYHKQGFEVVGVSIDSDLSALSEFLDKEKLPWVTITGEDKNGELKFPLAEKYEIIGVPTQILVGKDGKVLEYTLGARDLTKQIEKLLSEKVGAEKADAEKSEAK